MNTALSQPQVTTFKRNIDVLLKDEGISFYYKKINSDSNVIPYSLDHHKFITLGVESCDFFSRMMDQRIKSFLNGEFYEYEFFIKEKKFDSFYKEVLSSFNVKRSKIFNPLFSEQNRKIIYETLSYVLFFPLNKKLFVSIEEINDDNKKLLVSIDACSSFISLFERNINLTEQEVKILSIIFDNNLIDDVWKIRQGTNLFNQLLLILSKVELIQKRQKIKKAEKQEIVEESIEIKTGFDSYGEMYDFLEMLLEKHPAFVEEMSNIFKEKHKEDDSFDPETFILIFHHQNNTTRPTIVDADKPFADMLFQISQNNLFENEQVRDNFIYEFIDNCPEMVVA